MKNKIAKIKCYFSINLILLKKIYIQRYLCKNCNKKFTKNLDSVIKPHYWYANIYIDKIRSLIQRGHHSLSKIGEELQTFFGN